MHRSERKQGVSEVAVDIFGRFENGAVGRYAEIHPTGHLRPVTKSLYFV
jgi:hypothetical protein